MLFRSVFPFTLHFFLFDFYVTSFLSYLFASFLSHSFLLISLCYLLCLLALLLTVHSQGPFILLVVMGFIVLPLNYFCPGVGVLSRPLTGLSAAQPSPLPCAGRAMFHFQLNISPKRARVGTP